MASDRTVTLRLNQRRLNAALTGFLRSVPKARERAIRKIAFDVLSDTVVGITTGEGGNPKRVDTGRYRAAWRNAGEEAGVNVTASLAPALRVRGEGGRFLSSSRDGAAEWRGEPGETSLTLTNNVEYGAFVEYGTGAMAPGNHLSRALELARRNVPQPNNPIQQELVFEWGRR